MADFYMDFPEDFLSNLLQTDADDICRKALEEGALECSEMPHSETLKMMEWMDKLRNDWGIRYPFE